MNTDRIVIGDLEVGIDFKKPYAYGREATRKTRISVSWGAYEDVEFTKEDLEDEVKIKELVKERTRRMRAVLDAAAPGLAALGFGALLEGKLTWNPKAGCRCGCSPAFVADRVVTIPVDGVMREVDSAWIGSHAYNEAQRRKAKERAEEKQTAADAAVARLVATGFDEGKLREAMAGVKASGDMRYSYGKRDTLKAMLAATPLTEDEVDALVRATY